MAYPLGNKTSNDPLQAGTEYTTIQKKLTGREKIGHFFKILGVSVGFIFSVPAYLLSKTAHENIKDLFQEFKSGEKKVKILKSSLSSLHSAINTTAQGIISPKPGDIRPTTSVLPQQQSSISKPPEQPQPRASKSASKVKDEPLSYDQLQEEIPKIKADLEQTIKEKFNLSHSRTIDNPLKHYKLESFDFPVDKTAQIRFQIWFNAVKSKLGALKEAMASMENYDSYQRNVDRADKELFKVFQLRDAAWENEDTRKYLLEKIKK